MEKEKKRIKIWKVFLGVILAVVICAAGAFLVLTATEYKPQDVEAVTVPGGSQKLELNKTFTIVSYNTGYAALGENADFFMDGGLTMRPDSPDVIKTYLAGITEELRELGADIYLMQEVDVNSKRSYGIDETAYYQEALGIPFSFALNFKSAFTPFPLSDMMGRVTSGLAVYTNYAVDSAERIQLPVPFSWPISCFNLKRCLLVNRMPIEGTDKQLVAVDLHLEAYDDGEGKKAQTKQLYEFISSEYEKGNYVIAGGDFNQTFPGAFPFPEIKEGNWMPLTLDSSLPSGFAFAFDAERPTCRLLDVPYKGNQDPQFYIIDGFIVSENIIVDSVEVVETNFINSDHQPVKLVFTFGE